jgi:hypothetical protein
MVNSLTILAIFLCMEGWMIIMSKHVAKEGGFRVGELLLWFNIAFLSGLIINAVTVGLLLGGLR